VPSTGHALVSSLPRPGARSDDAEFFLGRVGEAWSHGAAVDWRGLTSGARGRRISLPTYPFERQHRWLDPTQTRPGRAPAPHPLPTSEAGASLQEALTGLWRELLGRPEVGPHEDFFELGGHSLLAVQLGARIRETVRIDFPQQRLLEHRTIAQLASFLQEAAQAAPPPPTNSPLLVLLHCGDPRRRPLFLLHPLGGTVFTYQALARLLDPEQPLHGARARSLEPRELSAGSLKVMAMLYLEAVRTRQPSRPYRLAGHSF
jgi:acyl transferase domain-containing protein